ncbi:MAG TPA: UDP-N-acetylmuramate--L-alanine ligase [Candidatus Krumholzibacteria bacterium]|nr:UDP-N-acetylmuramate--L-alanine ligase [Candidatus Krumholzibacteria bacterium]HPD72784.1 UDP-N-acetylmuramate--L-alanine ligase [Candidatus Krumholzibacteria bacterium]HRY40284.1 UDP-N-acetylmuramate--L-alanine ligase [Candidatus Krumholzibacteria bacterium]
MFRNTRHIHLVAIGGVGMSGIAEVLLNLGFSVSGSDLRRSASTDRLASLGARIHIGHAAEHVAEADVVVRSSAVTEANCEVSEARRRRIPVIRRAEMLAELMRLKQGVAVAGSHGKTTTTSLTAAVLAAGGLDPTVIVGGQVLALGTNAVLGGGDYLVAEADESDGSFLHLTPTIAVVTNIDHEHVDHYPDLNDLRAAFVEFVGRVPFYGTAVLCADDPEVRGIIPRVDRRIVTYGFSREADVRVDPETVTSGPDGQSGEVWTADGKVGRLRLPQLGRHNLRNALAAIAVGRDLGVSFPTAAAALAAFRGVGRRCESHGEPGGVLVLDDYGHHPTELSATMEVARAYDRRVAVLFQPHRYSRTRHFAREFADALAGADLVGLLPVYAAGEEDPGQAGSDLIAAELAGRYRRPVQLLVDHQGVFDWLDAEVVAGDLLLTSGAGDIGRLVPQLCEHLARRRPA